MRLPGTGHKRVAEQ